MKGIISIDFKEIINMKVSEDMIKNNPALIKSTEKVLDMLCKQTEKYFKDKRIKTKISYKLEK